MTAEWYSDLMALRADMERKGEYDKSRALLKGVRACATEAETAAYLRRERQAFSRRVGNVQRSITLTKLGTKTQR